MTSLDEAIEAVAAGRSTAVYQRPLTPRAPSKKKIKAGKKPRVKLSCQLLKIIK